jgi:Protein of unknown function (DUF1572)
MRLSHQLAKHLREIHFGKNWTWSDMQEALKDVTWQEATDESLHLNSIALLVFHMNYYLRVVQARVCGGDLNGKHEDSFKVPKINNEAEWQAMLQQTWQDAEAFAKIIEDLPDAQLFEEFSPKYGNYYRNIAGVIEHNHYHLGQVVVIKKLLRERVV